MTSQHHEPERTSQDSLPVESSADAADIPEELICAAPLPAQLEAALMVADQPLTARQLAKATDYQDGTEVRQAIKELNERYDAAGTAFHVVEIAGGFQMLTRPQFAPWLEKYHQARAELRLSQAALETLAVVAYRQPVMRADVEEVRGVQCGEMLRQLMGKGLVRITGRHESLGRPLLYGTTKKFLNHFGLKSLKDLPMAEQLKQPRQTVQKTPSPDTESSPEPPASPET